MYCRKCGKPVENGDAFCTYCGTPVPARVNNEPAERAPEEPVRRTAAAYNPEFKWNNSEFNHPPRKTEDINFDWTKGTNVPRRDTLEARPVSPERSAYPERPAYTQRPTYPQPEGYKKPADRYEPVSYEANRKYESELFRDMESTDRGDRTRIEEKFHTFAMKNEEFQKLLDREYERIRKNGNPIERPQTVSSLFDEAPAFAEEKPIPAFAEEKSVPTFAEGEKAGKQSRFAKRLRGEDEEKTQEIRTIWEEIKADLEREARENQAKRAQEAEEMRKNTQVLQAAVIAEAAKTWAEINPQEGRQKPETNLSAEGRQKPETNPSAAGEVKAKSAGTAPAADASAESFPASAAQTKANPANVAPAENASASNVLPEAAQTEAALTADVLTEAAQTKAALTEVTQTEGNPDDAELAAAEALKKMWANMANEEEAEPKKVSGWLVFFLILVVLGLLVAAGIGVQKWAPDTDIAAWCKTAEDWLVDAWDSLVEAVKNVFEK